MPAFANANSLWLQVINMGSATTVSGHDFHYTVSIPDAETLVNSSPLDGNLPPLQKNMASIHKYSSIFDIYRYDESEIIATVRVTDATLSDRVIWEGKVSNNPTTNETLAAVSQADDKHYNIHIEQNKTDQPSHLLIMQITNKE